MDSTDDLLSQAQGPMQMAIFQLIQDALAIEQDVQNKAYMQGLLDSLKLATDAGITIPANIETDVRQVVVDLQTNVPVATVIKDVIRLAFDIGALMKTAA